MDYHHHRLFRKKQHRINVNRNVNA